MGILTDFFVASQDEVETTFHGWLPVSLEKNRECINPYTGETQLEWGPDLDAFEKWKETQKKPSKKRGTKPINISQYPYVQYNEVDLVKLATLYSILTGVQFKESIDKLAKPALINPLNEDQGLHCIPVEFVKALTEIDDEKIKTNAEIWAQTDEFEMDGFSENDAIDIINTLKNLAMIASAQSKQLYHWWSL
ncbi:MAG: hypothetical protein PVF83_09700 [Anaerolineales bacterium]|jgi:hypothetical protein